MASPTFEALEPDKLAIFWGDETSVPLKFQAVNGNEYFGIFISDHRLGDFEHVLQRTLKKKTSIDTLKDIWKDATFKSLVSGKQTFEELRDKRQKNLTNNDRKEFEILKKLDEEPIVDEPWWNRIPKDTEHSVACLYVVVPKEYEAEVSKQADDIAMDVDIEEDEDDMYTVTQYVLIMDEKLRTEEGTIELDDSEPSSETMFMEEIAKKYPHFEFIRQMPLEGQSMKFILVKLNDDFATTTTSSDQVSISKKAFPRQVEIARELVAMLENNVKIDLSKFDDLDFLVLSPRFCALRDQTYQRILDVPFLYDASRMESYVAMYGTSVENVDVAFLAWIKRLEADKHKTKLFVLIDDECHFAANATGTHSKMVNHEKVLRDRNVIVLHVSATPQNCLSTGSRIPVKNVLLWKENKDSSLYRSFDYYAGTMMWHVENLKLFAGELEVFVRSNLWYVPHDYSTFCKDVNEQLGATGIVLRVGWLQKNNKRKDDNDVSIIIDLPVGKESQLNLEFLQMLGFPTDIEWKKMNGTISTAQATTSPLLGEPSENACCRPRAFQRVRNDDQFERYIKKANKRIKDNDFQRILRPLTVNAAKQRKRTDKVVSGLFLAADYLVSLAYFAFFRVKRIEKDDGKGYFASDDSNILDDILNDAEVGQIPDAKFDEFVGALSRIEKTKDYDFSEVMKFHYEDMTDYLDEKNENSTKTELWKAIVMKKLRSERTAEDSNDLNLWFSDTDRAVRLLLTRNEHGSGNMVMARVHENAHCEAMQTWIRHGVDVLKLRHHDQRPLFATIADTSKAQFNLFARLKDENWVNVPLMGDDGLKTTVRHRAERSRNRNVLSYQQLLGVPCLIFLCEKGRMGDTFPESLGFIDLRLRSTGLQSAFVQEFGRACRYPSLLKVNALSQPWAQLQNDNKAGFTFALVSANGNLKRHVESVSELKAIHDASQAGWNDVLEEGDQLHRYTWALPSILVQKSIFNILTAAVKVRNAILKQYPNELPEILDCLLFDKIDGYITSPSRKALSEMRDLSIKNGENLLHSAEIYRNRYQVSAKKGTAPKKSSSLHYDHDNKNMYENRLMLFAQTQIGKTGVFLEFLAQLKLKIKDIDFDTNFDPPNPYENVGALSDWHYWCLPKREEMELIKVTPYNEPSVGQYHRRIAFDRLSRMDKIVKMAGRDICTVTNKDVVAFIIATVKEEVIVSKQGRKRLGDLKLKMETMATDDNPAKELLIVALDWDNRLNKGRVGRGNDVQSLDEYFAKLVTQLDEVMQGVNAKWAAPTWEKQVKTKSLNEICASMGRMPVDIGAQLPPLNEVHFILAPSLNQGKLVSYLLSIPSEKRNWFKLNNGNVCVGDAKSYEPFVFIPSHNRATKAYFNFSNTLDMKNRGVVVVVRQGDEFDKYRMEHGHSLIIIGLPKSFTFKYPCNASDEEFTAEDNGVGFSRLFMQLVAHSWGLPAIWMLDDNVVSCYRRSSTEDKSGQELHSKCKFDVVMRAIERILVKCDDTLVGDALDHEVSIEDSGLSGNSLPKKTIIRDVCGDPSNIGILGMFRGIQSFDEAARDDRNAFNFTTHSVYSFVLLNIAALINKHVFYPAKNVWEDIEFLHCVKDAGLAVVKFARYTHMKRVFPAPVDREHASLLKFVFKNIWNDFNISSLHPNQVSRAVKKSDLGIWIQPCFQSMEERNMFGPNRRTDKGICVLAFVDTLKNFRERMNMTVCNWIKQILGSAETMLEKYPDSTKTMIALLYRHDEFQNENGFARGSKLQKDLCNEKYTLQDEPELVVTESNIRFGIVKFRIGGDDVPMEMHTIQPASPRENVMLSSNSPSDIDELDISIIDHGDVGKIRQKHDSAYYEGPICVEAEIDTYIKGNPIHRDTLKKHVIGKFIKWRPLQNGRTFQIRMMCSNASNPRLTSFTCPATNGNIEFKATKNSQIDAFLAIR